MLANTPPHGPVVAIIPARGGSKRIPHKNIRSFLGVPLLARTIALLKDADIFDRIVVSTDGDEVAKVAVEAGAEVPFRRPTELADDYAGTRQVVRHAIEQLEGGLDRPLQVVCCVYATAVLLRPEDLRQALDQMQATGAGFAFSATSFPAPIQRALRRSGDGSAEMIWPEQRLARSQDLEQTYHDAGQFYWGHRDAWLSDHPTFGPTSQLFVLPPWRVQDIDTPEDWRRAELMMQVLEQESGYDGGPHH
jgi:pseudaminic acid cytidylyltransferase